MICGKKSPWYYHDYHELTFCNFLHLDMARGSICDDDDDDHRKCNPPKTPPGKGNTVLNFSFNNVQCVMINFTFPEQNA